MLRIALPNKGRLADSARDLFADAGLPVVARGERALTASLGDAFEAVFVRARDIPELVADGAAEAGVTGWDLVEESGRGVVSRLDLGFGRCRVVVAATDDSGVRGIGDLQHGTRVATSFPRIAERFFRDVERRVTIVPISGSAEIAPHIGIADVIVDLVSTGSTLRVNGLREIARVMSSSAHLVVADQGSTTPSPEQIVGLDDLTTALQSVLRARNQRYVMANVPPARLDDVRRVLPGLNGPTVVNILDGGRYVAVHAVVAANAIYRTIADLKTLGGEGILVTRIERLMP
jgi:ATP phosphoribosyltransferase